LSLSGIKFDLPKIFQFQAKRKQKIPETEQMTCQKFKTLHALFEAIVIEPFRD
jgi:hypothetical protein